MTDLPYAPARMQKSIDAKIVNPLLLKFGAPAYATVGSAALDLRACIEAPRLLPAKSQFLFPTGLALDMQDPSIAALIVSRSGLSLKHRLRVAQGIGLIDSDFHGELGVILANDGEESYVVQPGERIAQLMFVPVLQVGLNFVQAFSTQTERGEGGFGSTGKG